MVGGALQTSTRSPLPDVWAVSQHATDACLVRADGAVEAFHLPTAVRRSKPPPSLPTRGAGRPSALAIRPADDRSPIAVAAGTDAGHLIVDARVVAILDGAPIAALVFQPAVLLAAGGAARELVVVDPATAVVSSRFSFAKDHRSAITAIAANVPARQTVLCSQAVTLVDFDTGKVLRKYTGHASPVSAAQMFPSHTRFVTGCQGDKFLFVWDCARDEDASAVRGKKRRKISTYKPLHTLIAPVENVRSIAVDDHETSGTSVAAVLSTGAVAIWRNWTEKGSSSPTPSSFVIQPSPPSHPRPPPPVFLACFSKVGVVTVLYGSSLKPDTHSVALNAQEMDETFLPVVHENGLIAKPGKLAAPALLNERPEPSVVQQNEQTRLIGLPAAPEPDKARNGVLLVSGDADMDDYSSDSAEEGGSEEGDEEEDDDNDEESENEKGLEPTLQDKLEALGVGKDGAGAKGGKVTKGAVGPVKLDSRVSIILQAVRSKDSEMLENCIMNGVNRVVIRNTVQRIPSAIATGDLLDILVRQLQKYPGRAETLVPWLKEILIEHASSLMAGRRRATLTSLMAIVDTRMQALEALSRLEGRLELVVGQASRLRREGKPVTTANAEAKAEYVEEEGDGEESSSESESLEDSDEGEGATGDSSDSEESSSDSDDKEEMEGITRSNEADGGMNGKKSSEQESSSEDSGDEDGD